ncbi:tRNA (adenosine(37)-N6)-dimethylallyltransferase MiaA [Ectobacillus panaciterrae]|uniref:tRNA (adenosine(37)-N6)-dimethylallyltransferase MiaA n=1 Tax=Ectobacillus panaciterrae TaxID=363872 RepID=UPI000403174E|nr:tRNA (adenosine(37)-N6)-dimethylallyltransferase MiaA [Ectobacillus panaciterrae]
MGGSKQEKVIVIIGPTAVGKTKLSIELAKVLNGEIISGDSMQVYRGMDIGTAKVTSEEMEGIPHYMIDIKEPSEPFSAAEFQTLVRERIHDISKRGKMPIIVGGTGLYIQAVLYDYQFSDVSGDPIYREELEQLAEREGAEAVFKRLQSIDPESAERIHPNNVRRVIRALEIFETTGKTMTESLDEQENKLLYDTALIGLTMERAKLYERINKRVDIMMEQGLLEEVKSLYDRGIRNCQSVQAIGYKELYAYFDGTHTLAEAVEALKTNSRRYAKRQLTWFRNKMDVAWFDVTDGPKQKEILHDVEGKLQL